MAFIMQLSAEFSSTAVLPDDGAGQWIARIAIPGDHGFTLVGDPDGSDISCSITRDIAHALKRLRPYFGRIVFHPAGPWIMLRQIRLRDALHASFVIEDHRSGRSRPRVEDQNFRSHAFLVPSAGGEVEW